MKTIKYLIAGALAFSMSTSAIAQELNYKSQISIIAKALNTDPNGKETKSLVKDYAKVFKKDPEALVALGNTYLSVKNFEEANRYADLAIARNKNYGDAYILKGDIGAMKDDGGEAAMWYQQAMILDPKNPRGYMGYANVNRKVSPEETEKALNELRKNVPDFPIDAEAAHTFYASRNYEKAIEHFKKCNKEKLDANYLGEYAITAFSLRDYEEGLAAAKVGDRKFPDNISFARLALYNAVDGGKFGDAITYANKLMASSDEKTADDYSFYGRALAGNQQYTDAIAQYEKALSIDKENFKPLQFISEAYSGMGDEDKALEYSQQYLGKNQNATPSDYSKLAEIYFEKAKNGSDREANYNKSIEVYENIAAKFPQIASYAHLKQANNAYFLDMYDAAITYYQKVIGELESKSGRDTRENSYLITAYQNTGLIYWDTKQDLETATPYFEKLIKLDPENQFAKQALGLDQPADDTATQP